MEPAWFILSDDLTGAADTAIAFARRRLPATVVWGDAHPEDETRSIALAYDAATRELGAAEAARRHRDVLRRFLRPRMFVFKKIDSTLRGHPAEEIAAMLDVMLAHHEGVRVVLAPSFPAMGRTVRDGRVQVHGIPLPFTEYWPEGREPDLASLVNLLESAGVHARQVSLSCVRADPSALRAEFARSASHAEHHAVAVCDAETADDLARIASASLEDGVTFFIGSAGLAHAIAQCVARDSARRLTSPIRQGESRGALVVVGSQASASRAALAPLLALENVEGVTLRPAMLMGDLQSAAHAEIAQAIGVALSRGTDVVVDIGQDVADPDRGNSQFVMALARVLAPAARQASALVVTGGETAAAVLTRIGVAGIRLVDEIEPGIPLGLTLGEVSVPAVTKAGGFGNEECLKRIVSRLRFIRQTGTVA